MLITAGGNPDRLRNGASFAALCGTTPVPASSGKTTRHRLSRGGDRHANSALHTTALVRMGSHEPTRTFVRHHRDHGRSTPEILRILKRTIAREFTSPNPRTTSASATSAAAVTRKTSPSPPPPPPPPHDTYRSFNSASLR